MRQAAYVIAALVIIAPCTAIADDAPPLLIGGTARITASGATFPCLPTKDDVDAATKAAAAKDQAGWLDAISGAIYLPNGTHVRGIDAAGFMYSIIQVRVESGDNSGASCWYPQGGGIFKDIVAPSS